MRGTCEALRGATAEAHRRLEATPFGRQLARGRIDSRTWSELLRATSIVVATLDTELRRHGSERARRLLPESADWVRRLAADLDHLAPSPATANARAHDAALDLAAEIRRRIADDSAWLLGFLYVLRGSHLGHLALVERIERALDLPAGRGTSYYRATKGDPEGWRRFRELLDAVPLGRDDLEAATRGALDTYRLFEKLFTALEAPGAESRRVTSLNPEAGDHPIVRDPEHLRIAIEAADRAHAAFGYLDRRFGERGRRFARSDGAWMPTLCGLPPATARSQLDWVSRLLASRGVPTICLEHHLLLLSGALEEGAVPPPEGLEKLTSFAAELDRRRRSALAADTMEELLSTEVPSLDPRGAEVLVAAAVDQRTGLGRCADRIREWLPEARGLDEEDVAGIRQLLDRTEQAYRE